MVFVNFRHIKFKVEVALRSISLKPCIFGCVFRLKRYTALILIALMIVCYGTNGFLLMVPSILFGLSGMVLCLREFWHALDLLCDGERVNIRN